MRTTTRHIDAEVDGTVDVGVADANNVNVEVMIMRRT